MYTVGCGLSASHVAGPFDMARKSIALTAAVLGASLLSTIGCKSSGSSGGSSSRDPIFGAEKIPPQGLPVYGATKKDPLLKGATATSRSSAEPYRPSASVTTAALAGAKSTPETDTLGFTKDQPKQEIVPVSAVSFGNGDFSDAIRKQGGRVYAPVKLPTGEYELRCAVPLGSGGTMRTYTATGKSQASATRELQAQIQADSGR